MSITALLISLFGLACGWVKRLPSQVFTQWLRGSGMGGEVVMAETVGWEDQAWEELLTDPGTVSYHRGF